MFNPKQTNIPVSSLLPPPAGLSPVRPSPPIARLWMLVLVLAGLLLAGCGPERNSASEDELVTAAQQIALDYAASGNLEQARSQLSTLQVANPNQWLIYVTETGIGQNLDPNTLAALVKLTQDLGLNSAAINSYGAQNNLLPAVENALAAVVEPDVTGAQAEAAPPAADVEQPAVEPAVEPTPTVEPTPAPTDTPPPAMAKASDVLNVRGGPGTEYNLAGALQKDELVQIVGKNPQGDWWQVQLSTGQQGWVLGQLVQTLGDTAGIAVAANIPAPPVVAEAPAPAQVAEAPAQPPAEAPTEAPPAPEATPMPDPNAAPHFTLVSKRLWNKDENDGCVGKHLLRIHVLDAAGNRLNGIRLKGIYTNHELVTGEQGKGDGIIEFDLHGSGEGFTVIRNNDGREVTSDRAEGFTTRSLDIPEEMLIATGYCTNHEDCQIFYNSYGCQGHHSWEATFQRNY